MRRVDLQLANREQVTRARTSIAASRESIARSWTMIAESVRLLARSSTSFVFADAQVADEKLLEMIEDDLARAHQREIEREMDRTAGSWRVVDATLGAGGRDDRAESPT